MESAAFWIDAIELVLADADDWGLCLEMMLCTSAGLGRRTMRRNACTPPGLVEDNVEETAVEEVVEADVIEADDAVLFLVNDAFPKAPLSVMLGRRKLDNDVEAER